MKKPSLLDRIDRPRAITMWDFSWLERRWDGAGYENWDEALDQLCERGYDAVRIDAFPHLIHLDPEREWELLPVWTTNDWGSPGRVGVRVLPELVEFLSKCRDRNILVELSSWFRKDIDDVRMGIQSGKDLGERWVSTLEALKQQNVLDAVWAVDLCNEWPGKNWAPYFNDPLPAIASGLPDWRSPESLEWMQTALSTVREAFPELPVSFSLWPMRDTKGDDLAFLDFLDLHLWVPNENDINKRMGYGFECFDLKGYNNLALNAEKLYRSEEQSWKDILIELIQWNAEVSRRTQLPCMTTECWAITDYKDWPMLRWDWIKELCALGTLTASETGRWAAISTSNFCGPQFTGMWRDVAWHRELTDKIKAGTLPETSTE